MTCLCLPPPPPPPDPQVILRLNELVWKYNIFPLDRLVLCFVRKRKGGEGRGKRMGREGEWGGGDEKRKKRKIERDKIKGKEGEGNGMTCCVFTPRPLPPPRHCGAMRAMMFR